MALVAPPCGNVVFCTTVGAALEAKAVVALFTMAFVIFQNALTAPAVVFYDFAAGAAFAPKVLANPQAGQKTCTGWLSPLGLAPPTSGV